MFVKHGCPRRQQSQTMAKFSKSYIFTPPNPQWHVSSMKCEQPLDEFTVQVWLLYGHPNFKYCTLFISGTELRRDERTDGRTVQTLDDPADLSGRGIKSSFCRVVVLDIQSNYLKRMGFPTKIITEFVQRLYRYM